MRYLHFSVFIFSTRIIHIWAQCQISTSRDFVTNSPLLIRPDGSFIYPDRRTPDVLNFNANQNFTGYCPQSMVRVAGARTGVHTMLPISCSAGTKFSAANKTSEFKDIICSTSLSSVTRQTGNCPNGRIVEIGFQLTTALFARTIDVCHNINKGRTYWAHAIIPGAINGKQTARGQPSFKSGDFFKNMSVQNVYTRESQRRKLLAIMGNNQTLVDKYIPASGTHYFAKGHLVAKVDLYYAVQQYSTFYYINALPMWQCINNGNWKRIEDKIRTLARNLGDLEVWVGGLYDLQLPYTEGVDKLIYLATFNSPVMLVPKLIFKLAYNRAANTAMVFITVNNPYLTSNNLPSHYQICPAYAPCYNNSPTFKEIEVGISYCCLYSDFMKDGYVKSIGLPPLSNPRPLF